MVLRISIGIEAEADLADDLQAFFAALRCEMAPPCGRIGRPRGAGFRRPTTSLFQRQQHHKGK